MPIFTHVHVYVYVYIYIYIYNIYVYTYLYTDRCDHVRDQFYIVVNDCGIKTMLQMVHQTMRAVG